MPWGKEKAAEEPARVIITRDFGKETLIEREVTVRSGDSVMDVLVEAADVDTSYGGAFVESVEGLSSSAATGNLDWFYYVNGILAGVGAREYEVSGGDFIWWDYHPWNEKNFSPAVVGAYTRPFSRGYSKDGHESLVFFSGYLESLAVQIGERLESDGAVVECRKLPGDFSPEDMRCPTMAVMTLADALDTGWSVRVLENPEKAGTFLALQGGKLVPLDSNGDPAPIGEEIAAAIVATGSGIGDESPVWMVLCDGEDGARQAGRLLVDDTEELDTRVGAVVGESGTVYSLPR